MKDHVLHLLLKDIDLVIEENKITAIVGTSGSGKTTLLKMILGFYQPVTGEILVGDTRLSKSEPQRYGGQKWGQ